MAAVRAAVTAASRASSTTSAMSALTRAAAAEVAAIHAAGTYKKERIITSPQAAHITVSSRGGRVLNFCGERV